jgi:simple sugar transport system permease protein
MEAAGLALVLATLRLSTPLAVAAMGERVGERAGVLNIGIEGLMLVGAFGAFAVGVGTGSILLATGAAVGLGCILAAIFAWFVLNRRADPIVTGTAVNLLALGGTGSAYRLLFPPERPVVSPPSIPELVPGVGVFLLLAVLLVVAVAILLSRTRVGLEIRATGERAEAAHNEGIPVMRLRWVCTLFGGACSGLAGAILVLWISQSFVEGMTAGRGFIALSLVLFGGYRPARIVAGALLFGGANALQFQLQAAGVEIPYALLLMTPYLLTLLVLALYAARAHAPGDLARPFAPRA